MADRFSFNPGEATISQCMYCKNTIRGSMGCKAFKDKIPTDILNNEHDHTTKHLNDGGILFEIKDDLTPEALQGYQMLFD